VEYGFTLIRRLQQPGSPAGGAVHFSSIAATTADNFAGAVQQAGATLSGITAASNVVTFPADIPGNYMLVLSTAGATSATAYSAWVPSAGASNLNLFTQSQVRDAANAVVSLAGTTVSAAMISKTITVAGTGGLVTLTPSTIVGGGTMDLWIFSLPASVLTLAAEVPQEYGFLKEELCSLREQFAEFVRLQRSSRRLAAEPDSGEDEMFLDEHKETDEVPVSLTRSMTGRLREALRTTK